MPKDPAFLFYPKDWLQGTSQMMPDEKGIYIDLLAHQHQNGDLPTDIKRLARMTGLSEQEFLPIWDGIKDKFTTTDNNRLVNQKLTKVVTERLTKSKTNRISGIFASIIRLSNESHETKELIKKSFKTDAFLTVPDHLLTERLTEWFSSWLANGSKSIVNANGNEDVTSFYGKRGKRGKGNIFGQRFSDDGNFVELNDGSLQKLGSDQKRLIQMGELRPKDIIKGTIN